MTNTKTKLLLVGGPDVNTRIPLMQRLDSFQISTLGSLDNLKDEFAQAGFEYISYPLHRGTNHPLRLPLVHGTLLNDSLLLPAVATQNKSSSPWMDGHHTPSPLLKICGSH